MTGRISDYQVEKWLEDIVDETWLALHFDNPDVAGVWNSEVFGGGYVRQRATMFMPSSRAVWNSGAVTFAGLPDTTITHVSGWTHEINGDMRFSVALETPVRVTAGGRYSFGPETVAISLD